LTAKEEIVVGREIQWLLDTFTQTNPNLISNRTMKKDMVRSFNMFPAETTNWDNYTTPLS